MFNGSKNKFHPVALISSFKDYLGLGLPEHNSGCINPVKTVTGNLLSSRLIPYGWLQLHDYLLVLLENMGIN